ncbi:hypothetical protein, partial [Puniceicoccus vermicola]
MTEGVSPQSQIDWDHKMGFALLVSLSLLSFLLLVTVALSAFLRVETQGAESSRNLTLARQNALFGLSVAFGELQCSLGPDTRVNARTLLIARDERIAISDSDLPAAKSPKAWWVGVVDSDGESSFQRSAGETPVAWLVSGLKNNDSNALTDSDPFQESGAIPLFDDGSIDLALLSDGKPIEGGRVPIRGADSESDFGSYAWIVDDEGLKAQLALRDPLDGGLVEPLGGGVLPGAFDLAILEGMDGLSGILPEDMSLLVALAQLSALGADQDVALDKRFDYTTQSLGVLADVRNGGLKRDLTIAFERDEVFDEVFDPFAGGRPKLTPAALTGDPRRQRVLMDREKLSTSDDLLRGGYIHWGVFNDYYNLKRFIMNLEEPATGEKVASLDPTLFNASGFTDAGHPSFPNHKFYGGALGPHDMAAEPGEYHPEHPYGDFLVAASDYGNEVTYFRGEGGFSVGDPSARAELPRRSNEYRHSPITPVLSLLQVNSWLEKRRDNPVNPENDDLLSKVQVWSSLYNPYNIGVDMTANYVTPAGPSDLRKPVRGPFLMNYPGVQMNYGGALTDYLERTYFIEDPAGDMSFFASFKALDNAGNIGFYTLSAHVEGSVLLQPGRSHVMTRMEDISVAGSPRFSGFTDEVADPTLYGIKSPIDDISTDSEVFEASVVWENPAFLHGLDFHSKPVLGVRNRNGEVVNRLVPDSAQVMFAPFAWDRVLWTYANEDLSKKSEDGKRVLKIKKGAVPRPGKKLKTIAPVPPSRNVVLSAEMRLRTTKEPGESVPLLAAANVRAMWCNPRWDYGISSSTDSPILAAYSIENEGETYEPRVQMKPGNNGRGYSYWGAGNGPADGYDRVILFDVPRVDLVSLGQLQHANAGRFSYEPSYIVGNSYPNPRIKPLDQWRASVTDQFSGFDTGLDEDENWGISGSFNLYDASYLVNEHLWDSFIFTTIPQVADNYGETGIEPSFEELLSGEASLPNPRFKPYTPGDSQFTAEVLQDVGDEESGSFFHNAGHLMVEGMFNVNSTSVDAWEAFLSGTHKLPVQKLTENGQIADFWSSSEIEGVRFPRVQMVMDNTSPESPAGEGNDSFWIGFRTLKQEEVRRLAEEIVVEVRKRGPFLSLGDFVNRKLEDGELGEAGALQAAIDRTINISIDGDIAEEATNPSVPGQMSQAAGFPGYLQQGDILQALSPYMTVRSDTFTVRVYGDRVSPVT